MWDHSLLSVQLQETMVSAWLNSLQPHSATCQRHRTGAACTGAAPCTCRGAAYPANVRYARNERVTRSLSRRRDPAVVHVPCIRVLLPSISSRAPHAISIDTGSQSVRQRQDHRGRTAMLCGWLNSIVRAAVRAASEVGGREGTAAAVSACEPLAYPAHRAAIPNAVLAGLQKVQPCSL